MAEDSAGWPEDSEVHRLMDLAGHAEINGDDELAYRYYDQAMTRFSAESWMCEHCPDCDGSYVSWQGYVDLGGGYGDSWRCRDCDRDYATPVELVIVG